MDIANSDLNKFLKVHKIYSQSDVSIIRLSDDTVFGDTRDLAGPYPIVVTSTDIISAEDYFKFKSNLSMNKNWTTASVVESVIVGASAIYTANVLPIPPRQYDPNYKPEFLIIHAISKEVFAVTDRVASKIDSQIRWMCRLAFIVGISGVTVIFFVVWYVSRALTQPLLWMEHVAWGIVNHADERASKIFGAADAIEPKSSSKFVPSTEISKLVSEFRVMITGFSGDGASTVAHSDVHEIKNEMTWQSDFQQLYSFSSKASRRKSFRMIYTECAEEEATGVTDSSTNLSRRDGPLNAETTTQSEEMSIVPAPPKRNSGVNIVTLPGELDKKCVKSGFDVRQVHAYRSSLFWWILVLIALPLVLTNAVICATVSSAIVHTIPSWIILVADKSTSLEIDALISVTALKATEAEMFIHDVVCDLHFMTRLTSWLFFDGISRSDSFSRPEGGTQECRDYTNTTCPFVTDPVRAPCACEWEDLNAMQCLNYSEMDARLLQRLNFVGQARDANNITGDRNESLSFKNGFDHRPNETLWWDNVDKVPGAEKGSNASGFNTTYDRIRVSSAMSIATFPIYNYDTDRNKPRQRVTEVIAFEADGLIVGFSGCNHQYALDAQFESTAANKASSIAPDLCPLGKFGCKFMAALLLLLTFMLAFTSSHSSPSCMTSRPTMQKLVFYGQDPLRDK